MVKIVFTLLVLTAATSCAPKEQEPQDQIATDQTASQTINEYPDIVLNLSDGRNVRARDLKGNNMFVLFQPDCDHCQHEAIEIEQRLEAFNGYTLYFISSAPMAQITAFANSFALDNKKNVHFASTPTQGVLDFYGPIPTPSVYIYANGRLKKSFNGQTDIENILDAL